MSQFSGTLSIIILKGSVIFILIAKITGKGNMLQKKVIPMGLVSAVTIKKSIEEEV